MPEPKIPRNITTRKAEKRRDLRRGMDGLFAREAIATGEIVWVSVLRPEDCAFYSWEQIRQDPILTRYSYQIGADLFSVSKEVGSDDSNYFNHSCDPNTWYDDSAETRARMLREYGVDVSSLADVEFIVARRDIAKDEEVTMDYATFWVVNDLEFECRCGAKNCRKNLRATDYRQQDPAHVSSYVRTLFR